METMYQYLQRLGLLESEATSDELAEAKQQYRKLYLKSYQQSFRQKNIRKDTYFTPSQFLRLSKVAKQHKCKSVPKLCKELCFAYLDKQFVLPDDKQVRQLELYLRGVTNNLNQLVRYIHKHKELSVSDISILKEQVNEMETQISLALRSPTNLQDFLGNLIQQKPETLSILQYIIEAHKPK